MDTLYPGYLMISARQPVERLHQLTSKPLNRLGTILMTAEQAISHLFKPDKIMINRHGFTEGHPYHFHLIPIYHWTYDEIYKHPEYLTPGLRKVDEPDGANFSLFIYREYCEKQRPLPAEAFNFDESMSLVKSYFSQNTF